MIVKILVSPIFASFIKTIKYLPMKAALFSMLLTIAFTTAASAQKTTGYAQKIAEKRFDSTSIPAGFKNYKGTLIVLSDITGRRDKKALQNLMEAYEGNYEIINDDKNLAADFPNVSKDCFILHVVSGIKLERVGNAGSRESYSYTNANLYLSNRFTKEDFKIAFSASDYWKLNVQYMVDKLNEKLHQKQ